MPEPTTLNNRYRLDELQGSGGMAVVYRAQDLLLERSVAIKILRRDFSADPAFRERFHHEAKAAANLSHPNIVTVHDFGLQAEQLFIVMEYVPGTNLKTMLKQSGRFGVAESIDLMEQACAGIGYAHRAGLVHCDLKPQNILVTPDNRVKVVDFGIARALSTISPDEQSDVVWGSPLYFSPEQAAGNAPSPASDVYSLGVVLFEMLTGHLPFTAATSQELARKHRETPPPSLRKLNPAIPVALEQVVLKVLSKEPSSRYRTADQLGKVLISLKQPEPQDAANPVGVLTPIPVFRPEQQPPALAAPQSPVARPVSVPVKPSPPHQPASHISSVPDYIIRPARATDKFDWLTWLLALLALIAVGGLVPFWLWVFYNLSPPI